jgi:Vitamin K-dependent gamma-carboxylase
MQKLSRLSFSRFFELDLRSIALLRICIAILIITDLLLRFGDLEAHYTDSGVVPRSLSALKLADGFWSIYALTDDPRAIAFLFLFNGLLAIALLVGWRSRWVAFGCWVLLVSLHYRNGMIQHGGDTTLRLLLFWGIFLPLGARYSVDSALNTGKQLPNQIACTATFAYTLQICFIYWFASLWKASSVWWIEQRGVYYALNVDTYATDFANWLLSFPTLLPILNLTALLVELCGPLLLFIPSKSYRAHARLVAVVLFILLHIGFSLPLNLGIFPWVSAASWLAFIPSEFWDRLQIGLNTEARTNLKILYDRESIFCLKSVWLLRTFLILPEIQLIPAQSDAQSLVRIKQLNSCIVIDRTGREHIKFHALIYLFKVSPFGWVLFPIAILMRGIGTKVYEIAANNHRNKSWVMPFLKLRPIYLCDPLPRRFLISGFLILSLVFNISYLRIQGLWSSINLPHYLNWAIVASGLRQSWTMFASIPPNNGWFVVVGKLVNEQEINLLNPQLPVSWEKPHLVSELYRNERWREYYFDLRFAQGPDQSEMKAYVQYQCYQWNAHHRDTKKIKQIKVDYVEEFTLPDPQPFPVQTIHLIEYRCDRDNAEN